MWNLAQGAAFTANRERLPRVRRSRPKNPNRHGCEVLQAVTACSAKRRLLLYMQNQHEREWSFRESMGPVWRASESKMKLQSRERKRKLSRPNFTLKHFFPLI